MQLNYKSFGKGPALIILHGLFGSLDNWQTLAKQYAETHSTYIVDQRNHGKSPHSEDDFNYQALADDLLTFMDAQGIPTASLLGHSMGGKTVMQFAVDNQERVENLIVADMSPVEYPPHHTEILETLIHFPTWKVESRQEADDILKENIPQWGVRQFLLKNLDRKKDNGFQWKFNLEVLYRDYTNILEGIHSQFSFDGPTLFVHGAKSDYVKDKDKELIKELFPEAIFSPVADAGHWLHADQPDAFFDITSGFLNKNS